MTFSKRPENDGVYEESVWGINPKHLKIRVKILVKMEDIAYLCIKKEGVYEYQRISFDIYGRTNRCHAS